MTEIMPTTPTETPAIDYYERCDTCNGYIHKFDPAQLKVGQKVQYTTAKVQRRGYKFTSREGTISEIWEGGVQIRTRGSTFVIRHPDEVTPLNIPNSLTYALCGYCNCNQSDKSAVQS